MVLEPISHSLHCAVILAHVHCCFAVVLRLYLVGPQFADAHSTGLTEQGFCISGSKHLHLYM